MIIQHQYIIGLAQKGGRIDKRQPDEYRPVSIESGIVSNAEGSAKVKIGTTEVLAGVKMSVEKPFPDKPDEGMLIVGAEFSPLASPMFEKGPPKEDAIELARVVDRGIRESKAIDMPKLCIKSGEQAWAVYIDIHILNHAGNLLDAAGLAAIAALLNTKMPTWDGSKVDYSKREKQLPVIFKPVPVTFVKIGQNIFVDANLEEESVLDGRLTITTRDDGNICAIQKSGSCIFTLDEIIDIIDKGVKIGKELRKLL
jgi:exosome complex component RRP42